MRSYTNRLIIIAVINCDFFLKMEQIKRANRLYTNDSIFLKKTLYIPILTEPRDLFNGLDSEEEKDGEEDIQSSKDEVWPPSAEKKKQETRSGHGNGEVLPTPGQEPPSPIHDLSASDFLKKLDSQISLSKKAAAQRLKKEESRWVLVSFKLRHRVHSSSLPTWPDTQVSEHSASGSKVRPFPQAAPRQWAEPWLLEWGEAVGNSSGFVLE